MSLRHPVGLNVDKRHSRFIAALHKLKNSALLWKVRDVYFDVESVYLYMHKYVHIFTHVYIHILIGGVCVFLCFVYLHACINIYVCTLKIRYTHIHD